MSCNDDNDRCYICSMHHQETVLSSNGCVYDCCEGQGYFFLFHICLVSTTMLALITVLVHRVAGRRKSNLEVKMVTEGVTPPFQIRRRDPELEKVGPEGESLFSVDSGMENVMHTYREYTMEIEFVNTQGKTVVRTYPDIRMPNNSIQWNDSREDDNADENNGIVVYHHPRYPQSAYLDYGWSSINSSTSETMMESSWCCYSFFGIVLVVYWWVAISSFYADLSHGLLWQTLFQTALLPVTIWYAKSSIGAQYKAYEDDILRNIPEGGQRSGRELELGTID